jgi:hypothetical protein
MLRQNRKTESTKQGIIDGYYKFMGSVDRADQMVHFHPRCRYHMKRTKGFMLFLLEMATLKIFTFCKKYTTNEYKIFLCFADRAS